MDVKYKTNQMHIKWVYIQWLYNAQKYLEI